jgi:hypothetical protein
MNTAPWTSIPEAALDRWRHAFSTPSAGVDVEALCPICGERQLHRYYQVGARLPAAASGSSFVARGALWEWCSNCRTYEHASALVPTWWQGDLSVDVGALTALPDALESALQQRLQALGGLEQARARSAPVSSRMAPAAFARVDNATGGAIAAEARVSATPVAEDEQPEADAGGGQVSDDSNGQHVVQTR